MSKGQKVISSPLESTIQEAVIKYFNRRYFGFGLMIHINNELPFAVRNSFAYYNKLKKLGFCVGFPDTMIIKKNAILLIEFKRKQGVLTEKQKAVHSFLAKLGHPCVVCRSYEEAVKTIDLFMIN